MKQIIFLFLLAITIAFVAQALGSCSTWRGFQQDVHTITNPNWHR